MSTFDVSCVLRLTVNKLALLWGEDQLCLLTDQLRTLNSLGWQSGNFAFSASFLILNEIMRPGGVTVAALTRINQTTAAKQPGHFLQIFGFHTSRDPATISPIVGERRFSRLLAGGELYSTPK